MTEAAPTDAEPDVSALDPAPPGRGRRRVVIAVVVGAVAVLGVSLVVVALGRRDDTAARPARNVTFVVPKGAAERSANGDPIDIMPPRVLLKVGDSITVRNEDTETATIGPFTVRPGEKIIQSFGFPQELVGECSLSGTGEIKIIVT